MHADAALDTALDCSVNLYYLLTIALTKGKNIRNSQSGLCSVGL